MNNNFRYSIKSSLPVLVMVSLPWLFAWVSLYQAKNMWISFFCYHWLLLCPIALWKRHLWNNDLKGVSLKLSCWILVFSLAACFIAHFILSESGELIVDSDRTYAMLVNLEFSPDFIFPMSIYFVIVNASLEELFWRGTVQNILVQVIGEKIGLAVSLCAILFGAWHYLVLRLLLNPGFAEVFTILIILSGVILGLLYEKHKSLTVPIMVHAIVLDLPLIVVLWQLVKQTS